MFPFAVSPVETSIMYVIHERSGPGSYAFGHLIHWSCLLMPLFKAMDAR